MLYIVALFLGIASGAASVLILWWHKQRELSKLSTRLSHESKEVDELRRKVALARGEIEAREKEFDAKAVAYSELENENSTLKHDLQNVDVNVRKLRLDTELQGKKQEEIETRVTNIGQRYLSDHEKWIVSSLTPNNYAACKTKLLKVIERCRGIGFEISPEDEESLVATLKSDFERIVRVAYEREEQARIKAQIREEQKLEREIERELQRVERERAAIQAALDQALAAAKDEHGTEIEHLRAKLQEAESRSERAKSRAQLTRSGHVYVLSNIGSFGEGIYKIGMTRRLEPNDRVKELGDASVPFAFDVHMMISSDDAPALENQLHRAFHKARVNKCNPRKEYFRSTIDEIGKLVREHHGQVDYVADPEALEYRQSLEMTEDDSEYIEHVYEEVMDDDDAVADEA